MYSDEALVVLNGGENKIEFVHAHNFYHIQNLGSAAVKVSTNPSINGRNDGVIEIPAGGSATIKAGKNSGFYAYGSGRINIAATDSNNNPFRNPSKGGGSGGGGTNNYPDLQNLPLIEGVTLLNDLTFEQLGWRKLTKNDAIKIVDEAFDDSELITFGNAAYFDATSVNTLENEWVNILDISKKMTITSGVTVNEDEIHFSISDNGDYETEKPKTIYAIFKVTEDTSYLSGDCTIITTKLNNRYQNGCGFDIFSATTDLSSQSKLTLVTIGNNVRSYDKNPNEYHIVCITINEEALYHGILYIDGKSYGLTPNYMYNLYYDRHMLINTCDRGTTLSESFRSGDVTFKTIVFDTVHHSEDIVMANTDYLRKKYLKGV